MLHRGYFVFRMNLVKIFLMSSLPQTTIMPATAGIQTVAN